MEKINQIEKIRDIESKISHKLFLLCSLVTLITMAIMLADFFTRGFFLPAKMNLFYIAVLVIYSLHKEMVRWLGEKKTMRGGEYFVYGWVTITVALYVINFLNRDYYSYSKEGYPLGTLRDISILTIEVLVVFIFTRLLKLLKFIAKEKNII